MDLSTASADEIMDYYLGRRAAKRGQSQGHMPAGATPYWLAGWSSFFADWQGALAHACR